MLTLTAALRAKPYVCQCGNGQEGMLFHVRDTSGLIGGRFIVRWPGPEAIAFVNQHSADLVPGRCLNLQVHHLRALADELRADVLQCSLAPLPPGWQTAVDGADITNITS